MVKASFKCSKTGIVFCRSSEFASESELYGKDTLLEPSEKFVAEPLLLAFDAVRKKLGHPLLITSGRRSFERQLQLYLNPNIKAGRQSTHCYGLALDVQVPWKMQDSELAKLFLVECEKFAQVVPRVGYLWYRGSKPSSFHLHVDLGPLLFKKSPLPYPELPESWAVQGLIF